MYVYVYIYIYIQILFPYRLLQNIEKQFPVLYNRSSLIICFTYSSVNIANLKLIIDPSSSLPFGKHRFVFCVCESISVFYISSFVSFFRVHI